MEFSAAAYLTQIWNAYSRGSGGHKDLIIKISPELFKQFEDEHEGVMRVVKEFIEPKPPIFKTARLYQDPNKTGIQVWIGTEDECQH